MQFIDNLLAVLSIYNLFLKQTFNQVGDNDSNKDDDDCSPLAETMIQFFHYLLNSKIVRLQQKHLVK